MSEIPPPANPPPPNYAGYTRSTGYLSNPDQLQALADGYFGLNTVFVINVVLAIASYGVQPSLAKSMGLLAADGVIAGVLFVIITALSLPKNKRIAEGMGWQPSTA